MMKIMMICNPYEKTIDYLWFDESQGKYIDLSEMPESFSELTNAKYSKDVTLQSRADEIVKAIDKLDSSDLGIEVHFIGTQDDFDDLKRVVELFYENKNIICIKEPPFFWDAEYALSHIKTKFSNVESILTEYKEDAIVELLDSYEKTIKPDLAICIMGLYSSGKSAFINSLVGAELLPSASDPTTAKVCKIQCRNTHTVTITVNGNIYTVCFDSDDPTITGDDEAVKTLISGHIHEGDDKIARMYHYLKFLNASRPFGEVYSDGELISITVPYTNTMLPTDKFDFVIYDTPGSNSASNKEHFKVLNDALTAQTNALPIILTTPDSMDSTDNDLLLDLIHNNANKLDTTNALIVVNKSDEKMNRALEEKKLKIDKLKLTKWKSTRIFFVSALLGLASKKENPHCIDNWHDEDMYELFEEKAHRYEKFDDARSLYQFNIVDKSRNLPADRIPDVNAAPTQLLLFNSGLASIEIEIENYARRYAQYIKAREAIKYLDKAIAICERKLKTKIGDRDDKLALLTASYKLKEHGLTTSLLSFTKTFQEETNLKFQQRVKQILTEFKVRHKIQSGSSFLHSIYITKEFDAYWKYLKAQIKSGKLDLNMAFHEMEAHVSEELNKLLSSITNEFNAEVDAFWRYGITDFKNGLCSTVLGSNAISTEQKDILNQIIIEMKYVPNNTIDFRLEKNHGIKRGVFSFIPIGKETYDNSGCCANFIEVFEKIVNNKRDNTIVYYTNLFYEWSDALTHLVIGELYNFNEELHNAGDSILNIQSEIGDLIDQKKALQECSEYISKLLGKQEE